MKNIVHMIDDLHWYFSRMLFSACKLMFHRRPQVAPATIVVLRHCFFGDFVVAIPALRKLRSAFPMARIVFLTSTSFSPYWRDRGNDSSVFDIEPGLIDKVVTYTSKDLSSHTNRVALYGRIGCQGQVVSVALCYSADGIRSRLKRVLLCYLLRLPFPLGLMDARTLPIQHVLNRWRVGRSDVVHQTQAALISVNELFVTLEQESQPLSWMPLQKVRSNRREPMLIGLAPFTKQKVKQWPLQFFAEAITKLAEETGAKFEVYGGPMEREMSMTLETMLQDRAVVANLCGELTPVELRRRLEAVDLLICLDSGPMHVASLVGTPVVSIFSQITLNQFWRPWGPYGSLVTTEVPCAQCQTHSGLCPLGTRACIEGITVDSLLNQVRLVLASLESVT